MRGLALANLVLIAAWLAVASVLGQRYRVLAEREGPATGAVTVKVG